MSVFVDGQYEMQRQALMAKRAEAAPGKLGRQIDVLRTSAWFEFVRHCLRARGIGDFNAAYSVGKYVQPATYGNDPAAECDKRWAKYAIGTHVPGTATLAQVEAVVPGATSLIDATRWSLLDCARSSLDDHPALCALVPDVFDCVFVPGTGRQGRLGDRRSLESSLCLLTDRAGTLDALVASVWLLREAADQGPSEECLMVGLTVHKILLMSLNYAPLYAIRYSLLKYFHQHVFPLTSSKEVVIDTPINEMIRLFEILGCWILLLEDSDAFGRYGAHASGQWRRIFEGRFGLHLEVGLGPRYELCRECGNGRAREWLARERTLREQAHAVLATVGSR